MTGSTGERMTRLERRFPARDPFGFASMTDEQLEVELDHFVALGLPEQIARWRRQAEAGDAAAIARLTAAREAIEAPLRPLATEAQGDD